MNSIINKQMTTPVLTNRTAPTESHFLASQHRAMQRVMRCLISESILEETLIDWQPDTQKLIVHSPENHSPENRSKVICTEVSRFPGNVCYVGGAFLFCSEKQQTTEITQVEQLLRRLHSAFKLSITPQLLRQTIKDINNSVENDALARTHRQQWRDSLAKSNPQVSELIHMARDELPAHRLAIFFDQWGSLEGHPYYPTWKTKPDLTPDDVRRYSPEFAKDIPLTIGALHQGHLFMQLMQHIQIEAADVQSYRVWFAEHYPSLWQQWLEHLQQEGIEAEHYVPLPIHPWHLQHFLLEEFQSEIEQQILIPTGPTLPSRATMSFRTMAVDHAPSIKLPIALWLTSEMRSLQAKSIHMGPRGCQVLRDILASDDRLTETLSIAYEEVGLHYKNKHTQDDAPGRFLSVVYRQPPVMQPQTLPVTVAALLTAGLLDDKPLIAELIETACPQATEKQIIHYFRDYLQVVLTPVLRLYFLYGIGLEAHQQNATVVFNINGQPQQLQIKDFGDGRTYAPLLRARGFDLKPYVYGKILPTVFEDDISLVRSLMVNATFVCHLNELAITLCRYYQIPGSRLWSQMRTVTTELIDALKNDMADHNLWQTEKQKLLNEPWAQRSLFTMHLQGYSDYRVEHGMPNPMTVAGDTQ